MYESNVSVHALLGINVYPILSTFKALDLMVCGLDLAKA